MYKTILSVVLAFMLLLFVQCKDDGFQTNEFGLQYKFVNQNTTARMPKVNDVVTIRMKYTDASGKIIEQTDLFRTQLKSPSHAGGCIEDALLIMHEGDSAIFKINAENYYTKSKEIRLPASLTATENLTFYIKLLHVISAEEFAKERQIANLSDEREEERLLKAFI